jgi:hypothetical protein
MAVRCSRARNTSPPLSPLRALAQVSVAVLLDNFVTVSMRMENDDKKKVAKEKKASSQFQNPLEPLVAKLANEYTDSVNLSAKLASLFHVRLGGTAAPDPLRGNTIETSDCPGVTGGGLHPALS